MLQRKRKTSSSRKISDVFDNPRKKKLKLRSRHIRIELSAKAWRPLYARYRFQSFVAIGLILIVAVFGTYRLTTHATIAILYPTACLGGWVNPHNAEGKPDVAPGADPSNFSATNSAVLSANTISEIYCGSFTGDISENSQPKKILLNFSWATPVGGGALPIVSSNSSSSVIISSSNFASSSGEILDSPASSSPDFTLVDATTTATTTVVTPIPVPIPDAGAIPLVPDSAPASTPAPATDSSAPSTPPAAPDSPSSFLNLFTNTAFAYDASSSSASSSTLTESESSSSASYTDTTTNIPESGFIEVDYTLDGSTWNILGLVDQAHFYTTTFEIPLAATSSASTSLTWRDMSNIQIRVKSISSIDAIPPVYLDGMSLQITYGDNDPNFKTTSGLYIGATEVSSSTAAGNDMSLYVRNDETEQELVIASPQAPIGGLAIYSASSSDQLLTTYVSDVQYSLSPEYFGIGTYDIIITSDPNNCSNESYVECLNSSSSRGSGSFEVVNSNQ